MSHPPGSIVPPFILEALAAGDDNLARRARVTLDHDRSFRSQRAPGLRPQGIVGRPRPARGDGGQPHRSVHDAEQSTALPGTLVRAEGQGTHADRAVNEAYDGLGHTWRLFWERLGRDSLDGRGLGLVATVHYGRQYVNAFWDGQQMVFGDGDGEVFGPFTASLDVIAHELAHGVTQYTSGLHYADQSGALNEHVSDVFGAVVKQFALGQSAEEADWLIGAELLLPGVEGVALRSMAAPGTAYDDPRLGTDPQPGHMRDFVDTTDDYGGVHINSGIPNKAFHLVATSLGGPSWLAPAQIWYDVITGDIRADCDFATFADLTVAAASDRFGADSPEADAVRAAWAAVGVTAPAPSGPEPDGADEVDGLASTIEVRRTGGFAGTTRRRTVDVADLPQPDADRWRSLLATGTLTAWALDAPAHPDSFSYGVRCPEPRVDVSLPERSLPEDVRALFERTLES